MYVKSFLSFKTRRHLKKNVTKRQTTDFKKARKIGILFTAEGIDKHNSVKSLIKELKEDGKEVTVLSYLGKGKQNHEFLFEIISPNDISFWGSIKSDFARKFIDQPFDYLLDLDVDSNRVIENILAMSRAKCRVGLYKKDKGPFFEMMINPRNPTSVKELIEDIHRYTKNIVVNGE